MAPLPRNHVPASQYLGSSLPAAAPLGGGLAGGRIDDKLIDDHLAVQAIIRSYQVRESELQFMHADIPPNHQYL